MTSYIRFEVKTDMRAANRLLDKLTASLNDMAQLFASIPSPLSVPGVEPTAVVVPAVSLIEPARDQALDTVRRELERTLRRIGRIA